MAKWGRASPSDYYFEIERSRMVHIHDELMDWLKDDSRPGIWQVLIGGRTYDIFISDPNVAFEFKLRWM